jgi:hypothetical protein
MNSWNPKPDQDWSPATEPDPSSDFVDFAEFDSEQEFIVVRGLLESAGIETHSPTPTWALNITESGAGSPYLSGRYIGGSPLILQLHSQDVDTARALLDAPPEADPEASNEEDE